MKISNSKKRRFESQNSAVDIYIEKSKKRAEKGNQKVDVFRRKMKDHDARSTTGRLTAATAGNGEEPAGSAAAVGLFVAKQRLPRGKPAHSRGQAGLAHNHAQVFYRAGFRVIPFGCFLREE